MPVLDVNKLIENRVQAIRDYHKKTGITRAQLDVSGGVDSAVMLGLLAQAIGPRNITAVYSGINSSDDSCYRAHAAAKAFDVDLIEIDLTKMFGELVALMKMSMQNAGAVGYDIEDINIRIEEDPTILGSIRSCLRAPIGRGFNRLSGGGIRHGTGNECEDRWLRFYQKGGDGEVDTNPLAMLSKGEVYQLAIGLGVPESILLAMPSPDLQGVGDDHNDEDELRQLYGVGWDYSRVSLGGCEGGIPKGDYTYVGSIERMSRFLDRSVELCMETTVTSVEEAKKAGLENHKAAQTEYFPELTDEEFAVYFDSYLKINRSTYHKYNPNCPTLGQRIGLVLDGILTNKLPLEVNEF